MASHPQTSWTSGTGTEPLPAPAVPARGTGVPEGSWRGSAFGERLGQTERTDRWWFLPLLQAFGLVVLIGYANYAAFLGAAHYRYIGEGRDYLSPFYSPYIHPAWLPAWLSPALLILVFPLGFRATCYYYRKAYYRSFFADPIACAVGERTSAGYRGETKFPFILQNLHRYFLYAAIVILLILWWDAIRAFVIVNHGHPRFGIGGGSLAILASTGLLTMYTLSCHSLRHLMGGGLDCFSCAAAGGPRHKTWSVISLLNEHHMAWAWWSLFAVCFADFYVRMCSMGVIHDVAFFPFELFTTSAKPF